MNVQRRDSTLPRRRFPDHDSFDRHEELAAEATQLYDELSKAMGRGSLSSFSSTEEIDAFAEEVYGLRNDSTHPQHELISQIVGIENELGLHEKGDSS